MTLSEELTQRDISIILNLLGVEVNGSGADGWQTIKSPLRDEKKPSFGINHSTGAWKDHSSGEAGDIVNLVEQLNRMETTEAIQWIRQQTDLTGALYQPPPSSKLAQKTPEKNEITFWTDEKITWLKSGIKRLQNEPEHPLLKTAADYDRLDAATLIKFGCGIVEKWGREWIALPYPSGCQLYRREKNKEVKHLKGSTPGGSFFGMKQTENRDRLFIAKSPREAMLLHKNFSARADAIGICTGEQSKVSQELRSALRKQISRSNYSDIYVFFDCDTDKAKNISSQFCSTIVSETEKAGFSGSVYLVNIYGNTSAEHKDITDCVRAGMDLDKAETFIKAAEKQTAKTRTSAKTAIPPSVENMFSLDTAPPIPQQVYETIPETIQSLCRLIDQPHRRDVFLMAMLPVVASHMGNVLAAHADGYYSADLYTLIVADPGAGKGIAGKAKRLATALNKKLIEDSQRERIEWEQLPDETRIHQDEPKKRALYIPANSSSRAIYDTILANGGNGLLFETEIDTLLGATSQEWGNFSDITRKAFHHEAISINRKNEQFFIEKPRLSICISGTFDQFKAMFESAENGHFSRYALYTFDVPKKWHSHRPTKRSRALDDRIDSVSEQLLEMWKYLNRRSKPLYIDLSDEQWQAIDDTFAEQMQYIKDMDLSPHLHASNNRAAVLSLRLTIIFIVLRTYSTNPQQLEDADCLTPTNRDITAALFLAYNFITHAIRLYQILPKATDTDSKGQRYKQFVAALPNEFKTAEALGIAENLDIPPRTAERWLGDFTRIGHGHYRKA